MNGEEDAFYSQDIQIVQYDAAAGFFTDIGEPYSFETDPGGVARSRHRGRRRRGGRSSSGVRRGRRSWADVLVAGAVVSPPSARSRRVRSVGAATARSAG